MKHLRSGPRGHAPRLLTLALACVLAAVPAIAQTVDSTRPMYRVPLDEFVRGVWINFDDNEYSTAGNNGTSVVNWTASPTMTLWDYADALGMSMLRLQTHRQDDVARTIMDQAEADTNRRVVLSHLGVEIDGLDIPSSFGYFDAGFAQNAVFLPFDSVRFSSWQNRFMELGSNVIVGSSSVERNEFSGLAGERVMGQEYGHSAGDLIGSGVVYNWVPWQTHRMKSRNAQEQWHDSTVQNADYPLAYRRSAFMWVNEWYISLAGHLFEFPGQPVAADADPLFRVEIWHEVPKGWRYREGGQDLTATDHYTRRIATISYLKSDFAPIGTDFDHHRRPSKKFGIADHFATTGDSISQRLDIRVYWTGAEKAALRSVSLRDPVAELLLSETPAAAQFKGAVYRHMRSMVFDENGTAVDVDTTDDTFRDCVIGIASAGESLPTELDAMKAMNHFIKSNFGSNPNISYRMPVYAEDGDLGIEVPSR